MQRRRNCTALLTLQHRRGKKTLVKIDAVYPMARCREVVAYLERAVAETAERHGLTALADNWDRIFVSSQC